MDRGAVRAGSLGLLERGRELDRIERVLAVTGPEGGAALVIEGPAGIGKTALIEAACSRAAALGMTVLRARGDPLEQELPFGIARQLFEPRLNRVGTTAGEQLLTGAAAPAAAVLASGDHGPWSAASDPPAARLNGLYWLTVRVGARAPVLVAVDEAQWSDQRSRLFLEYLIARLPGVAVSVIVATERAAVRLADRGPPTGHVSPAGLSEAAVAQLLTVGLGQTPDPAFAAACARATGGVPFYLYQLMRMTLAEGIEPTAAQAAAVSAVGEITVAHATLARLARLPARALALAQAVGALGREATRVRATQLAGLAETVARRSRDALAGAEIIEGTEQLEFTHPTLRRAIYHALAPGERSLLHHRAAGILVSEGADPDIVAAHLLRCVPTASEEVARRLRDAAAVALARGAPEAALIYTARASEEGADGELAAELAGLRDRAEAAVREDAPR